MKVALRVDVASADVVVDANSPECITLRSQSARLQRAYGQLTVSLKRRGPDSVLDGLRQVGCLKARFPRPHSSAWLDVVTLNTSGGIAGGDYLESEFVVGEGARVTI